MGYIEISTRVSIHWIPDAYHEPTQVIVLNVGSYFVDLRVLKNENGDLGDIEWAMAGERQVLSNNPLKCRWIHHIDSNSAHATPDEASFTTLPNGDELEEGIMPCPSKNGELRSYEEIWRKIPPSSGTKWAWIVRSEDKKLFIGRIGNILIGLVDREEGFGAWAQHPGEDESEAGVSFVKYKYGNWRSIQQAVHGYENWSSVQSADDENLKNKNAGRVAEKDWAIGMKVEMGQETFEVIAFERVDD